MKEHLGVFDTKQEAALAYDRAARWAGGDKLLNYEVTLFNFEVTFEKGPLGLGLGYNEDERVQVYRSEEQASAGGVQELDLLAAIRTDLGWVDATSVTKQVAGDIIKAQSRPVQLRFCRSTLKLT
jgi:hypothetical protein